MCKDCDTSAQAEKSAYNEPRSASIGAAMNTGYAGNAINSGRIATPYIEGQKRNISQRVKHLQDAIHDLPYSLGRDAASVKLQEVEMWAHKAIFPG